MKSKMIGRVQTAILTRECYYKNCDVTALEVIKSPMQKAAAIQENIIKGTAVINGYKHTADGFLLGNRWSNIDITI